MSDGSPIQSRWKFDSGFALILSVIPTGFLIWHLRWGFEWPTIVLPISLAVFTFVTASIVGRYVTRFWTLLITMIVALGGAHTMIWLPFLVLSYSLGQGAERVDYSVFAAIFTASTVAWYILGRTFWISLLVLMLIGGLIFFRMRRISVQRAKTCL